MTATIALPRQPHSDWLARLRTIMVLRPGQRVVNVPGIGVSVSRRAVASGGVDWWLAGGAPTPVAVYQPKGAASLAASYVNLANPGTYDAAPGVAPMWAAETGWTFNGSTQYLDTGYAAANTSNKSLIVRYSGVVASSFGALVGVLDGPASKGWGMQPWRDGTTNVLYISGGSAKQVSPQLAAGVLAIAGTQAYRNGVADGTAWTYTTWTPYHTVYIGMWRGTLNVSYLACSVQAVAIYETTLTAPQVAAVSAAMAAL